MDFLGNFVYYFIDNGIEIIEVLIVFITFFELKATYTRKNIFLSIVVLLVFCLLWNMKKQNILFVFMYIMFNMIEIYVLYSEFEFKKLFLKSMWTIIFINIIDGMVYNTVIIVIGHFYTDGDIITKLLTYVLVLLFLLILSKFVRDKVQFVHKISAKFYIIYLFIGFADYLILAFVFIIMNEIDRRALIISIIVSVSILIQYSFIFIITITNEGLKFQHYLNKKYIRVQQENYEYLEYREEETKKFRHDYRNHLNSLQILCKEKRYNDVENYINDISERLNGGSKYITVCNSFVDAILNYYYQKTSKNNVKLNVSGKLPKVCYINLFDLCTIISNLMDNALEALEYINESDRYIEITFRYDDLMIYCNIINPYNGELNIYKNIITSKKNNKNHGYGLSNVRKSVNLYNGSMEIKTDNMIFEVLIALINQKKLEL